MTKIEFVTAIISLYKNNKSIDSLYKKVIRGRGRAVSSQSEDLFGIYVSELLGEEYTIYIDKRMKVGEETFFPDIAICKERRVFQMWDLKMDLGWVRGKLWTMIDKNIELIKKIRKNSSDPKIDQIDSFTFAEDITYNFLIITLCNGGKDANNLFDYANNKEIEMEIEGKKRCMEIEESKVFYIFKHRGVQKTGESLPNDDYHPNQKLETIDLEHKMSFGTFQQATDFILAIKGDHSDEIIN